MTEYYGKKGTNKSQKEWETKVCDLVEEEWSRGKQYVSDLNKLYEDIYSMFRGERPDKNYDWQSDLSMRKAFQVCWTTVTYAVKKIFGASPVVGVEGFDRLGAWQREMLLEKWSNKDNSLLFHVMAWLRLVLNGVVFVKKTWKKKIVNGVPQEDHPHNEVLNNKDVVVDWMLKPGQSCKKGRFIIHQDVVNLGDLYGQDSVINLDLLNLESITTEVYDQEHSQERTHDNTGETPDAPMYIDLVVRERQGTFAVNEKNEPVFDKKKIYKKDSKVVFKEMIVWVADPGGNATLIRWEENPYGEKTIYDGHLYLDPERWHSAGQIEPSKDIFTAIDDNINAMFDEIWRNLMPPTVFNKFALVEWDTIQHAPGQKWMVGGNPNDAVMFPRPSNITGDAWQKHVLLDSEQEKTNSVTSNIQGAGKEKTATQGVLNTQFSTDKMDLLLMIYESTVMRTDAKMTIRFAQKFADPMTFIAILGAPFKFDTGYKEEYRFCPAGSSVKLEQQKEVEIQQDIQLIQILGSIKNPNTPKVINQLFANIMRNRNHPEIAVGFDEDYYEPSSPAGNIKMAQRMLPQGDSNQNGVPMSDAESSVRNQTFEGQGLALVNAS
jgi:hypothetical protein